MLAILAQTAGRIGHPALGYIIPSVIFTLSFIIAFYLYKHFTQQMKNKETEQE